VGKRPSKDGKRDDSETPTSVVLCNLRIVPEYFCSSGNAHPSVITVDILISDRQIVGIARLTGALLDGGRMATVFQVELDVAQGSEVYDVGVQLAARKNRQP
jgi:hypothetical protein